MVILIVADIMKESLRKYTDDDTNKFKTIVVFVCRGVEPVDFSPRVTLLSLSLTLYSGVWLSGSRACRLLTTGNSTLSFSLSRYIVVFGYPVISWELIKRVDF